MLYVDSKFCSGVFLPIYLVAGLILFVPSCVEDSFAQIEEPDAMTGHFEKIDEYMYLKVERAKQEYAGPPSKYETGIHLLGIGEIDKTEGTYELDFWFWVRIHEEDDPTDFTITLPEFDFVNAKYVEIQPEYVEPHYYESRVIGTFRNAMDFHNFPFEKLNLQVVVEPTSPFETTELIFTLDPESRLDPLVAIPGFQIDKYEIRADEFAYSNNEKYDRFYANFIVDRSMSGSFFKNLFPVTLIAGISLIIFWIPENFTSRIYLTAPLLLSLVYFHRTTLGEIPSLGYITMFDKIMIIYYVLFVNSLLSLGFQMRYHITHNDEKVKKINRTMRNFVPVIIGVGLLFIFLT